MTPVAGNFSRIRGDFKYLQLFEVTYRLMTTITLKGTQFVYFVENHGCDTARSIWTICGLEDNAVIDWTLGAIGG